MSSAGMKKSSSHNGATCSALISEKPSQRSATAARLRGAAMWSMWNSAIRAGIASSPIIRAGIGIAQKYALVQLGQTNEALDAYKAAVQFDPKDPRSQYGLGWNLLTLDR